MSDSDISEGVILQFLSKLRSLGRSTGVAQPADGDLSSLPVLDGGKWFPFAEATTLSDGPFNANVAQSGMNIVEIGQLYRRGDFSRFPNLSKLPETSQARLRAVITTIVPDRDIFERDKFVAIGESKYNSLTNETQRDEWKTRVWKRLVATGHAKAGYMFPLDMATPTMQTELERAAAAAPGLYSVGRAKDVCRMSAYNNADHAFPMCPSPRPAEVKETWHTYATRVLSRDDVPPVEVLRNQTEPRRSIVFDPQQLLLMTTTNPRWRAYVDQTDMPLNAMAVPVNTMTPVGVLLHAAYDTHVSTNATLPANLFAAARLASRTSLKDRYHALVAARSVTHCDTGLATIDAAMRQCQATYKDGSLYINAQPVRKLEPLLRRGDITLFLAQAGVSSRRVTSADKTAFRSMARRLCVDPSVADLRQLSLQIATDLTPQQRTMCLQRLRHETSTSTRRTVFAYTHSRQPPDADTSPRSGVYQFRLATGDDGTRPRVTATQLCERSCAVDDDGQQPACKAELSVVALNPWLYVRHLIDNPDVADNRVRLERLNDMARQVIQTAGEDVPFAFTVDNLTNTLQDHDDVATSILHYMHNEIRRISHTVSGTLCGGVAAVPNSTAPRCVFWDNASDFGSPAYKDTSYLPAGDTMFCIQPEDQITHLADLAFVHGFSMHDLQQLVSRSSDSGGGGDDDTAAWSWWIWVVMAVVILLYIGGAMRYRQQRHSVPPPEDIAMQPLTPR